MAGRFSTRFFDINLARKLLEERLKMAEPGGVNSTKPLGRLMDYPLGLTKYTGLYQLFSTRINEC